jgi:hypothetical protein
MKVADGPDAYGYTIFCDDLRIEVGNKIFYIGVYANGMNVNGKFPVALPKFAMDIVYLQRTSKFVAPTKLIVVMPGETEDNPSMVFDFPEEIIAQALEDAKARQGDASQAGRLIRMGGPTVLTNFVIKEPGSIKVRIDRGDEYIRLGALEVRQNPAFADQKKEAAG